MPLKHYFIYCLAFAFYLNAFSQTSKKTLVTKFTNEKIVVDGKFDEDVWKTTAIATGFEMSAPDNGKHEPNERRSEVKIVYDNEAIYVSAILYDNEPSKIQKELTTRDNFASADHFGVFLNGYNDGQQEFRFFVSASGVQQDVLFTDANGEDYTWNAIWDSNVLITDIGWNVEMKIPYAALRFSSEKKQTWGLNFYREVFRDRHQFTWNLLDNKIGSEANQAGILEGIENIETPTRLFLIPYSSFYLNGNENQKTKGEFKGGIDVKYGINDAFTLDAILIPDFGQTAFDKVELNLGPFEQQFAENRPFFTEGTDLFNKGDLFYSRRIGGEPTISPEISDDEEFTEYPSKVNLLNALKISGRTKDGLGIGVLNAVTEKTEARIKNTTTGATRNELIEPLANYNIFVLDQRFRKNSSISLINTNVMRDGEYRDANVSALVFDLNTKKNTYNLSGDYKFSHVNEFQAKNRNGYNTSLNLGKTSGKIRYGIGGQYISDDWDNNDLGINFQNHFHAIYSNTSYRILKPNKTFNSFSVFLNLYSEFDNRTGKVQESSVNINVNSTSKKNNYHGFGINSRVTDVYDFYEPRSIDEVKFLEIPRNIGGYYFYSSNYAKKFALDFNPSFTFINEKNRTNLNLVISPRYRFSDKISMIYSFQFNRQVNNIGWIDFDDFDNPIFAKRNRNTFVNSLTGKYSVNNIMTFNLSVRHYWSYAINHEILDLLDDGSLTPNYTYTTNKNSNLNTWNMDLSYSWWFAPGSQLSVLYRNNSSVFEREFDKEIGKNFRNSLNHENLDHTFSVSVRYFIDYNSAKHWFSKK
ncbi:DUF5916 domain-containing protein [Flavobacterium sp.]|uniref:DUF5916 domain-containing protein n=1 Tax=Flavobacterium sp. TaxID=239 RepID=UPI00262FB939|nr:DUF5916 domain-containing protein [Flavobacterium sp.]